MLLLPSAVLLSLQVIVSVLLVIPLPAVRRSGLAVVGFFHVPRAAAAVRTISVALVVFLLSSIASIQRLLAKAAKTEAFQSADYLRTESALYCEYLQALVLGASLLLVLLDHTVYAANKDCDRLKVSHEALQRQAKNAGSEFLRLQESTSNQVDYAAKLKAAEEKASDLQQQVDNLKATISNLEDKLVLRLKDKQIAETAQKDLEAMKLQAQGLAKAYDTLLADKDNLQTELGRYNTKYAQVEGKKSA